MQTAAQSYFFFAGEALDVGFAGLGLGAGGAFFGVDEFDGALAAERFTALARVVFTDPPFDVRRDAGVDRSVPASDQINPPANPLFSSLCGGPLFERFFQPITL